MQIKRVEPNREFRMSITPKNTRSVERRSELHFARSTEKFFRPSVYQAPLETTPQQVTKLQDLVRKLEEENRELKETILAMKTNELYQLNADKVKDFLRENDNLRQEVKKLKSEMDNALIEKDFLKRNNDALKERYEEMIKEGGKQSNLGDTKVSCSRVQIYGGDADTEDKNIRSSRSTRKQLFSLEYFKSSKKKIDKQSSMATADDPEKKQKCVHKLNQDYFLTRTALKSNQKNNVYSKVAYRY